MSYRTWQPRSPPLKKLQLWVHLSLLCPCTHSIHSSHNGLPDSEGDPSTPCQNNVTELKVTSFLLSSLNLKARPKFSSLKSSSSILERVKWLNHYSPKEKELASVCITNLPKNPYPPVVPPIYLPSHNLPLLEANSYSLCLVTSPQFIALC